MASSNEIVDSILNFSMLEYASTEHAELTQREMALLDTSFEGIALSAPAQIKVTDQGSISVALASRMDGNRDWDIPLERNCCLVTCNLGDGSVQIANPIASQKGLESRAVSEAEEDERPEPEELEGEGAQILWLDITDRVELPLSSGNLLLSVIYFDWLSNQAPVELVAETPAPDAFDLSVKPLPHASGFPTYLRQSTTPAAPQYGADFRVRLIEQADQQQFFVTGAFRMPVRFYCLTDPVQVADRGTDYTVGATVPLTFVVVGHNRETAWQFDICVPVYGSSVSIGTEIEGCFTLDILPDSGISGFDPGNYACYLVQDGNLWGPQRFSVG